MYARKGEESRLIQSCFNLGRGIPCFSETGRPGSSLTSEEETSRRALFCR